ncbi:CheR family methyltransferase [Stutzerimonas tarimensis]|uniref:protein-glutamate O-methyltransferase n=1 Tax=Stutzerimonas tarimensis TaxID=1507735 RepID=A0ABV7T9L6_9GAMM
MHTRDAWAIKPLADMSSADFNDWQELLERRTGIVVSPQRRSFLLTNLTARMRELGIEDYASYYRQVTEGPRGAVEWVTLLDRLTVQETRCFRHSSSFARLARYLEDRLEQDQGVPRPWSLWSVGCATGEEAYSLAMQADSLLRARGQEPRFGVTATDISLSALSRARKGLYPPSRLTQVEPSMLETYFNPQADGRLQVVDSLAERLCFARLNVLDLAKAPMAGMDVIFCQNLLIYFHRWRRHEILNHLAERLAPGGLLVIGVGEAVDWQHETMLPVADDQVLAFTRKKQ